MSTVSKIPQNRASRIAGPSKLPSRILRPTLGNKPSSTTANFVSSAKQIEKKKESEKLSEKSEISTDVSVKGKPKPLQISTSFRFEKVDCNGNKRDFVRKKSTEGGGGDSTSTDDHLANAKYYEMQRPTGNSSNGPRSTSNMQNDDDKSGDAAANFRSLQPGYFLQKVNAIKSSRQQKTNATATSQIPTEFSSSKLQTTSGSSFPLPSRSNVVALKDHHSDTSTKSETVTSVLQHIAPRGRSRLDQFYSVPKDGETCPRGNETPPSARETFSTRAEKRKKYLEMRSSKFTNEESKLAKENAKRPEKDQERGDTCENELPTKTGGFSRRMYARKPPLRSAKIAKPVIRPKKTPSPITPKPFVLEPVQKREFKHKQPPIQADSNIIEKFLNESPTEAIGPSITKEPNPSSTKAHGSVSSEGAISTRWSENFCDDYSVNSIASEESGYSSVASTVYLDTRVNGAEGTPSSSFHLRKNTRALIGNRDSTEKCNLPNGDSSNSLSDITSTELEEDPERTTENQRYCAYVASRDIVTYSQYRMQAEGNYSPEERFGQQEARLIRTSSSSSSDVSQSVPDSENTSDSSTDTVIRNTKTPNLPGELDENFNQRDEPPHPPQIVTLNSNGEDNSHGMVDCRPSDVQFFSASGETFFATAMLTPEPSCSQPDTPSTSSTSKAKKRKTDSLTAPLNKQENKDSEENSPDVKEPLSEKRILFKSGDRVADLSEEEPEEGEEDLSELLDLPSMHESALMTDYNSLLEDEYPSDEETQSNGAKTWDAPPRTPNAQTNVINKLLCQGLNGIVGSEDRSPDDEFTPLTNGCHYTEDVDASNSTAPPQRSSADVFPEVKSKKINHTRTQDDLRAEIGMMKMLLMELHRTLQVGEIERERQIEENRRLVLKNQKLTHAVESLNQELTELKLERRCPSSKSKEVQVSVAQVDSSTETTSSSPEETSKQEIQTKASPRWFHSEVSDKVESNIKKATEEIKLLKDLREDFDRRINDAEQRLNSTLLLFHK